MQLLDQERRKKPGARSHILRKQVELTLTNEKSKRNCAGNTKVPASAARHLFSAKRLRPSSWAGTLATLMGLVADPGKSWCRDFKFVKDGGHVVVGICREYTIAKASRVRYFAGDATFKTVMPETRRIGDTELFLYNICCPSREGGGTNSAGTVCFRAVMNGLSAEVYQVIWKMFFGRF